MPCFKASGILVPAGTVIIFPSLTELAWSFGGGSGSVFGVMGPSICCASIELPAKRINAKRSNIEHLAQNFTATLDIASIDGVVYGKPATSAAKRRRCAWDFGPSAIFLIPRHWPKEISSQRFRTVSGKGEAELLLVRCLKR